jgi:release factor glutamine methyltransferase
VIVSNPPYLSHEEVAETQPEIQRYEPTAALAAPDGGFGDLEKIIAGASCYLRRGGLLALETGIAQHPRILDAIRAAGFAHADSQRDLAGRDRFILAVF